MVVEKVLVLVMLPWVVAVVVVQGSLPLMMVAVVVVQGSLPLMMVAVVVVQGSLPLMMAAVVVVLGFLPLMMVVVVTLDCQMLVPLVVVIAFVKVLQSLDQMVVLLSEPSLQMMVSVPEVHLGPVLVVVIRAVVPDLLLHLIDACSEPSRRTIQA